MLSEMKQNILGQKINKQTFGPENFKRGRGGGFQAPRVPQKLYLLLKYSTTECMNLHHNPTPNRCVNLCQLILITTYLYRPQNEVWGKVIVLLVCVILFTGGGGLCQGRVSVWGGGQFSVQ